MKVYALQTINHRHELLTDSYDCAVHSVEVFKSMLETKQRIATIKDTLVDDHNLTNWNSHVAYSDLEDEPDNYKIMYSYVNGANNLQRVLEFRIKSFNI